MKSIAVAATIAIVALVIGAAALVEFLLQRDDLVRNAARERYQLCEVQQDTIAVLEVNLAGGSRIFVKLLPPNDPDLIEATEAIADKIAELRASRETLNCPPELIAPLGPPSPIGKNKKDKRPQRGSQPGARQTPLISPPARVAPAPNPTRPNRRAVPPQAQQPPTRQPGQLPTLPSLPPRPSPLIQIDPPPVGPLDPPPVTVP